jgi:hypothetical protein
MPDSSYKVHKLAGLLSSKKVVYCLRIKFGKMILEESLTEVQDPRRLQGQRISKTQLFSVIIISNLCGHFGGRPISRFAKSHAKIFKKELGLKHPIPSHVTISTVINAVDQTQLIGAFKLWTSSFVPLAKGDALSGDGKALGSTLVGGRKGKNQNYQAIVSLFCQKSGLVYSLERYNSSKESEINVIRFLIKELKNMGVTLFLDALHTQKKQ